MPPPNGAPPRSARAIFSLVVGRVTAKRTHQERVAMIGGAAALVVLIPLAMWVGYRVTHVISRTAQVKGYITNVGAQLDGVVKSVEVENGQRVRAGQIIARFEDVQLQANLLRAQSRLTKARRELEVERMAIEQEARRLSGQVAQALARSDAASSQVEAAQSQADDARGKLELRKTLAKGGMIPPEELRTAETTQRTAAAVSQTAQADRAAALATQRLAEVEEEGLEVRRRHISVMEADIEGLQAELSFAEADAKAAVIRAPADGWVVRRIAEAGSSVVVGAPIAALWIGNDIWVEAWIDEDDLANVTAGNKVRVTVKPYPHRVFSGVVETVGVSTDYELPEASVPQPRTTRMRNSPVICVRVRLEQRDGLFPGLSAVVGIQKKRASS